jgi:[glutamine synthetase] adenylyltransferase / [glutamine synthetase]-adenylyl-L-tyrosine phosphorylase
VLASAEAVRVKWLCLGATYQHLDALVRDLPDPEGARLFRERIAATNPRANSLFERDPALLADALTLAAWSPFLGTTLEQNPDYLNWLARERTAPRVRTVEELGESLARFALTRTQLDPQVVLARFRRRELLRIYLHDIRRTTSLVETTEELSNLADAVLGYALGHAQQELENLYGAPQCMDKRGRITQAQLVIIALGKLGSRELNYSSDVDLLFLYSEDGETSGRGDRGAITNREFFCKLAERVARMVGQPSNEGAAYRVDLRLRPHGRVGALAVSLAEALRYYGGQAQPWELQTLIRSRAAAGSARLFERFAEAVRARVFRRDVTAHEALAHVREAKQKIDRHHGGAARGFNVKLGAGGIREIEFVAQALQLTHGGRDPWLQAPHTLIGLGRLADRGLLTERERSELSDAYLFLRTLEHRLQMEHGLQTHTIPEDSARRALVARRMHFTGAQATTDFDRALAEQTGRVRAAFARVFGPIDVPSASAASSVSSAIERDEASRRVAPSAGRQRRETDETHAASGELQATRARRMSEAGKAELSEAGEQVSAEVATSEARGGEQNGAEGSGKEDALEVLGQEAALLKAAGGAAAIFARRLTGRDESNLQPHEDASAADEIARMLRAEAAGSLNSRRALSLVVRIAASLDKSGREEELRAEWLPELVRLCGSSEVFGEMIASDPALLLPHVVTPLATVRERDHRSLLRAAVDPEREFGAELAALRRAWACLLVEIGAHDAAGHFSLGESNRLQNALAAAAVNVALLIARRELARRTGPLKAGPRLAVLGLGRFGSGGTDFGSDLDLVLVYDPEVPSPVRGMTCDEAYARLAELTVTALSSLTREGYLYRVDLRLRPDGSKGLLATSARAFWQYLSERADVWEWLAYVKLRAAAGDIEFGRLVEREARRSIHRAALAAGPEVLRVETRRVRERLERERGRRRAGRGIDIKYGPGGMLDVYFAARFLQLRDDLPDEGDDRSTAATLARLREASSLDEEDAEALCAGYSLLRRLDHGLRLLAGRTTRLPAVEDHPVLRDLARLTGFGTAADLMRELALHTAAVRRAYDRITRAV